MERIKRGLAVAAMALALSGCAFLRHDPPSCDGTDRRPMNSGKWDTVPGALGGPQQITGDDHGRCHSGRVESVFRDGTDV